MPRKPHDSPYRHAGAPRPTKPKHGKKRSGTRKRRQKKRGKPGVTRHQLTSHPTTANAYAETRAWLLKQHGPVCAYCGLRFVARTMTLDHVAPRRGQKAYDRRDNLVLACRACNEAKRDLAPLAFLLGLRSRAVNLVRYGSHLSIGLLDLARSLVPTELEELVTASKAARHRWNESADSDDDSPYRS